MSSRFEGLSSHDVALIEAAAARVAAELPPPTQAQLDQVAVLLRPATDIEGVAAIPTRDSKEDARCPLTSRH